MSYSFHGNDIPHRRLLLHGDRIQSEPYCPEDVRQVHYQTPDGLSSAVSSVPTLRTNDYAQVVDFPRGDHLQPPLLYAAPSWQPNSMVTVPSQQVVPSSVSDPTTIVHLDRGAFGLLLRHTGLEGTITHDEWTKRFGKVSCAHPFGESIWRGMYTELVSDYLPFAKMTSTLRDTLRRSREHFRPAWFEVARHFSMGNAKMPKDDHRNPGRQEFYPCMALEGDHAGRVTMICINIMVKRSPPWSVDASWISW